MQTATPGRASDAGPEQRTPMDTMDLLFEAQDAIRTAFRAFDLGAIAEERKFRMVAVAEAIDYLQRALKRDFEGRPYLEVDPS